MASIKNLKKDIEYLTYEVISDCYTYMYLFPQKKEKEVLGIIENTVKMRNDLIIRVNHPDGKDNPKLVKAHYKKIVKDLITNVDKAFEELSTLIK
ncbi:MAG: hypothetical protein KAT68_11520 [Bacteroidales bacterium]|nr:hypothetical protein [Bacteroidales bacterium]